MAKGGSGDNIRYSNLVPLGKRDQRNQPRRGVSRQRLLETQNSAAGNQEKGKVIQI